MPNSQNVTSPILLIGAGRSATSWVVYTLQRHPDVQKQLLPENSIINAIYSDIFESWWSKNWKVLCNEDERERRAIAAAWAVICELFPGNESHWVMKAIWKNQPWNFMRKVFPDARYIHVVRCPTTAVPSIMEFVGKEYPVWKDLKFAEREYIQAHYDALALRDAGVPYMMVRQEDIRLNSKDIWQNLQKFCGLKEVSIEDINCELNASPSMRGKVKDGRSPIAWTDFSAEMFKLCEQLGYTPPPEVKPRDELERLSAERDELAQRCASLIKEQEEFRKEQEEFRKKQEEFRKKQEEFRKKQEELTQQLDRCLEELNEIVNSRTWKAIKITKKNSLLRGTGHLTLNLAQACKKIITSNNP
jgi:ElaB/YqjD/DUF883 family membrane-anchored ribosome-binding protein